jgi:hypothetical protein
MTISRTRRTVSTTADMPTPTFTCPHCETDIDHLNFSASVSQYGSTDLDLFRCRDGSYEITTENWDVNNEDVQDSEYTCPECDRQLCTEDILVSHDHEEIAVMSSVLENTGRNVILGDVRMALRQNLAGLAKKTDLGFCTGCHELKEELKDGQCESCLTN